ncbi:hypothetical protein RhiirA1_495536 [Rhizophagus irregularis]|uniref:Uncharacterized protein n=1 Tax=Rhizophagus irregularis TaxID=588596 RepID=A0A2I1FAK1_9GLOM|nr:hypothetical protein RhiirA1_495536 [Rhizophagus irregularis]PKY31412.1 hypothetical protein RhiirB3_393307 [Rhizophagus irregularis]
MGINTCLKTLKSSKKDSNNCTKNSKNKVDNSQITKRRKTNNVLPNSANFSLFIEESDPAPCSHLALAASKNSVKNSVKNSNNKLKYTNPNISKKNLKNQRSSHLDTDVDNTSDDTPGSIPNDFPKDIIHIIDDDTSDENSHHNSLAYKLKFVLYSSDLIKQEPTSHSHETSPATFQSNLNKPTNLNKSTNLDNSINHATPEMLAILVNEAKIMFLRARNPHQLHTICCIISDDISSIEDLGSYVDDTVIFQCLRNPIAQVIDLWWEDDKDTVDAFRMLIVSAIKIHIINILKCKEEPHISNAPALNEVKTLDYITRDLRLPHPNATNYANNIDLNLLESSRSNGSCGRGCGRRCRRGCRSYGHGRGFGQK